MWDVEKLSTPSISDLWDRPRAPTGAPHILPEAPCACSSSPPRPTSVHQSKLCTGLTSLVVGDHASDTRRHVKLMYIHDTEHSSREDAHGGTSAELIQVTPLLNLRSFKLQYSITDTTNTTSSSQCCTFFCDSVLSLGPPDNEAAARGRIPAG